MTVFETIITFFTTLFAAMFTEHYLKFRPSLPEKFVMKSDCQRTSDQIHSENREDHKEIFAKLDQILQELGKKVDRRNGAQP